MSHRIRIPRRQIFRVPLERYAWSSVRRGQARRALRILELLYRRAGL
jgi:hypothetical protein